MVLQLFVLIVVLNLGDEMDRYCNYCGAKIREGGNFCEGCGRKILSEEMKKKQMEEKLREELKEEIKKEFVEEQKIKKKQVDFKTTPLNLRNTSIVLGFSLIIAVSLVTISIIISGIAYGTIDKTNVFVLEIGFPFGWFKMTNTEIGISSWLNLFVDFILYTIIGFVLFLGYDYYKSKKPERG